MYHSRSGLPEFIFMENKTPTLLMLLGWLQVNMSDIILGFVYYVGCLPLLCFKPCYSQTLIRKLRELVMSVGLGGLDSHRLLYINKDILYKEHRTLLGLLYPIHFSHWGLVHDMI